MNKSPIQEMIDLSARIVLKNPRLPSPKTFLSNKRERVENGHFQNGLSRKLFISEM